MNWESAVNRITAMAEKVRATSSGKLSTVIAIIALIGAAVSLDFSRNARSQMSDFEQKIAGKMDSSYVAEKVNDLKQDIVEKASRDNLATTNQAVSDLASSVADLHSQVVYVEGVANGAYRTATEAKKSVQTMENRLTQASKQAVARDNLTQDRIKELGQTVGELVAENIDQDHKINKVVARQDSLDAKLSDAEWFKKVLADPSPPKRKFIR